MQSAHVGPRTCTRAVTCRRVPPAVKFSAGRRRRLNFAPGTTTRRDSFSVAALVQKVSEEELEAILQERETPLIVDFFATWCGPCVMLAKELEQVAEELGDQVRVVKIDVDENPNLSSRLQIQGLPTMVFIGTDAQKPALRTEGFLPADTIKQILRDEM